MKKRVLFLTSFLILFGIPFLTSFQTSKGQDKQFELLPVSQTGVDFSNDIKDQPEHNIFMYSNYYGGGGVGIGDFNNDGLPDLFFAGNLVADRLYINKGEMKFEDITTSAGNFRRRRMVIRCSPRRCESRRLAGHICNPGIIRRSTRTAGKIGCTSTEGDLTFSEEAAPYGIADTARTRHATFLDYDRDGDLDLFLLNQPPNPGSYSTYLGSDLSIEPFRPRLYRKDGVDYVDVSREAGILEPGFGNSVSASDFNGDGWTDIYLANDFYEPDRLYINQQDGTFLNIIDNAVGHISFYSMGVDAADINNDGMLDISVVDMVADDNYRSKANMSGMNPDAFWKVVRSGGHYQYMYNTLFLNQGNDYFSDIAQNGWCFQYRLELEQPDGGF